MMGHESRLTGKVPLGIDVQRPAFRRLQIGGQASGRQACGEKEPKAHDEACPPRSHLFLLHVGRCVGLLGGRPPSCPASNPREGQSPRPSDQARVYWGLAGLSTREDHRLITSDEEPGGRGHVCSEKAGFHG
jgi:hypothetical protein